MMRSYVKEAIQAGVPYAYIKLRKDASIEILVEGNPDLTKYYASLVAKKYRENPYLTESGSYLFKNDNKRHKCVQRRDAIFGVSPEDIAARKKKKMQKHNYEGFSSAKEAVKAKSSSDTNLTTKVEFNKAVTIQLDDNLISSTANSL